MRHLFLWRRNYIKPSRPGFKTTTKGKFSVGYTRLKNGNPKFFHFPNFHWYFYEMHQIVIERNREAWIGFLLLFGHWIHFIDFMSIFYLIHIASFVRWGLFSSPFFVIFFLRNEQTLECNFKYCETFTEFPFSVMYKNGILLPKLFQWLRKKNWNSRLKAENLQNFWDHQNNLFKQWKLRTIFGNRMLF